VLAPRVSHREAVLRRFSRAIARELTAAMNRAECDEIALIAPPRVLSLVRSSLSANARRRILLEIPKDLVHQPPAAVRREVRAALGMPER
jgi:protein required for attachment to host cells